MRSRHKETIYDQCRFCARRHTEQSCVEFTRGSGSQMALSCPPTRSGCDCMSCSSFARHAGAAEREAATCSRGEHCQRQQGRASCFSNGYSRKFTAECCSMSAEAKRTENKQTENQSVELCLTSVIIRPMIRSVREGRGRHQRLGLSRSFADSLHCK
jgi:hypothetical protein